MVEDTIQDNLMEKPWINVTKAEIPQKERFIQYLDKIWSSRWLTNEGELSKRLECEIERYLGVKDIVLLTNGTLAIDLCLRGLEIKGEVITTPFTFAATINLLIWNNLTPVFVDIDPLTFNIDPKMVREAITDKTTAILAVHVYGNPCAVQELERISNEFGIPVIYDAAHAFGVSYNGRSVLCQGDASTLSFHATKVFNTIEGGGIISKSASLMKEVRVLRNHGILSEFEVAKPGTNAKMNEFQAAMGLCNLEVLNEKINLRKIIYGRYLSGFNGLDIGFQKLVCDKYNYIYMPILLKDVTTRDEVYKVLMAERIKPRKYFFPLAIDYSYVGAKQKAYYKERLLTARIVSNRVLCLPLYSDLDLHDVDNIIKIVSRFG